MKRRVMLLGLGCLLGLSLGPRVTAAQDRSQLIQNALDEFDPDQARLLLRQALDPALGAPDSIWGVGVQLMAQLFIDDGDAELAGTWLRWALRIDPGIVSNTIDFTQEVVDALAAARTRVAADTVGLQVSRTTWNWATNVRDGPGLLRVEPVVFPVEATVVVERRGILTSVQPLSLPAGTYGLLITAPGYQDLRIEREVIPGVTTNIGFSLATAVVAPTLPPDEISQAMSDSVLAQTVLVTTRAAVGYSFCGTGYWADANGLIVTTYRAIRGADAIDITLSDGRVLNDAARIAAYDVARNVAVLSVGTNWTDALTAATSVDDDAFVWSAGNAGCGAAALTRTTVASQQQNDLTLGSALSNGEQGGPLVTQGGAVVGLGEGGLSAVSFSAVTALLADARTNVQAGNLLAADVVAQREFHRYGAVRIAGAAGVTGIARVSPMQPIPWEGLDRDAQMPFTYYGPEGRYTVALMQGGVPTQSQQITINAGVLGQFAFEITPQGGTVTNQGGGFPAIPVLLVLGAGGGAACALALCKPPNGNGGECPSGQTGTPPNCTPVGGPGNIIVSFPDVQLRGRWR